MLALLYTLAIFAIALPPLVGAQGSIDTINHFVVIYQENWSFDSLFGKFPGANGIANAGAAVNQVDKDGQPYATLPQPINTYRLVPRPDPRFPADLPVAPFDLAQYVAPDDRTGDMVHRYYQEQYQINGGTMDKFVAWSDAAGLVMSYYDATNLPVGKLAQQYVLMDDFFHGAFGGSFLNHFWLVCACTPTFPNAPDSIKAQLDANGMMTEDGQVTPDGYVVNTSYSVNTPHPRTADPAELVPNQTMPNIGDRLSDKNIDWAWYAGGWDDAIAGHPDLLFQFHHQPFVYFATTADGTTAKAQHLKDEQEFFTNATNGTLPAVSFVKPLGPDNEHPGYATLAQGQQHVADLVSAVQNGPNWQDTAIIITYDENGGRWDHVGPPAGDRWGPGSRVPALVISPYAKTGYVDHTQYDTTSILKLIETRWNLAPLGTRDAQANNLTNAFAFSSAAAARAAPASAPTFGGVGGLPPLFIRRSGEG
jgi:phospholipase C